MKKLYGFLLIFYYGTVSSVFLPVTKLRGPTKPPLLPPELTEDELYKLKIPNKRFCDEMEKKLHGKYLLVPWLFQNCQVIKDNTAKNLSRTGALPVHKAVIEKIHHYRRSGLLKYNSKNKIPSITRII